MPRTIVISAWRLDNSTAGSPIAKQKPSWEEKLSELKNQIAATKNVAQAADLWVFCVPEYFFYDHANGCPYNESDKEIIRKGLAGIGSDITNLLTVPGSIYWSKTQTREREKMERSLGKGKEKAAARDLTKYLDRLKLSLPNSAPELGDAGEEATKEIEYLSKCYKSEVGTFEKIMQEDPAKLKLVKNTAYFVARGEIVHTYDKKYPADTEMGHSGECFLPGVRPPAFDLTVKGKPFRIGIELCADHVHGSLMLHTPRDVDIHLVISCYVGTYDQYRWVRDSGLFVHCDSKAKPEFTQMVNGAQATGENNTVKLLKTTDSTWDSKIHHAAATLP